MLEQHLYSSSTDSLSLKTEISSEEFVSSDKINEAMTLVNSLDLKQMDDKLVNFYGWAEEEVSLMNDYYKKWLAIHVAYPELAIAPSVKLDEYWHMHILDTKKYMEDCQLIFGHYLHHYPYFGLEGDKENLDSGFETTRKLFQHHFNHDLLGVANPCASSSCR